MSDVQQFHSLRQLRARLAAARKRLLSACSHRLPHLRQHAPKIACSLFLLAHIAAHAQCLPLPAYPPLPSQDMTPEAPERTLHRDLRASIAAQKDGKCQTSSFFKNARSVKKIWKSCAAWCASMQKAILGITPQKPNTIGTNDRFEYL